jgi:disulfide bond formation protein DsbB
MTGMAQRAALQSWLDHPRLVPSLIIAVSLGALATAYAFEVWGGLQPCILCYYQRYAYGIAFVFGLLGLAFGGNPSARRAFVVLGGLSFLGGAAVAGFHTGVEQHWWRGTAECHAPALDLNASVEDLRKQMLGTRFVPCDQIPWSLFGLSMAAYNFLVSLVLAFGCFYAARRMRMKPRV